jgi:hypothetical protein
VLTISNIDIIVKDRRVEEGLERIGAVFTKSMSIRVFHHHFIVVLPGRWELKRERHCAWPGLGSDGASGKKVANLRAKKWRSVLMRSN